MQEMTCKLRIVRQAYKEEIEAEQHSFQVKLEQVEQSFQIELGRVDKKMEQLQNEVKALRSSGQFRSRSPSLAKAMVKSSWVNEDKRVERQTVNQRPEERNQEYEQVKALITNVSTPNQPQHTQPLTGPPHKSYAQMAISHSSKVSKENTWTKVTSSQ